MKKLLRISYYLISLNKFANLQLMYLLYIILRAFTFRECLLLFLNQVLWEQRIVSGQYTRATNGFWMINFGGIFLADFPYPPTSPR